MTVSARDILDLIGDIGGKRLERRVSEACAGRKVNFGATALLGDGHPLRTLLGPDQMVRLIAGLDGGHHRRHLVRFPETHASDHLRRRRARAALIRKLTCDGLTVRGTARAAKVHRRTVEYHRARMRAEGLLPEEGVHVG